MGNSVRKEIEKLIEAGDLRGLLYKAGELHGHFCNTTTQGLCDIW